jgi:hypothetical protein
MCCNWNCCICSANCWSLCYIWASNYCSLCITSASFCFILASYLSWSAAALSWASSCFH